MDMNDLQRKRLALLRIKRQMPKEFEKAGLSYKVCTTILSEADLDLSHALVIFKNWNSCTAHGKHEKLRLAFNSSDVVKSRYPKRFKLATKLANIMGIKDLTQ